MKIICIGRNYIDHAKELKNPVPKKPLVFMKPPSALLIDNKPLYYPEFTNDLHYEVELVLKIGKNGRHIQEAFAESYIKEIGLGIDFTARDVQSECKKKGHPWEIAKAFDHSACIGKFQDANNFNLSNINFELLKNEIIVQTGNTKDLIFDFTYLISYVSKYFKLQIGDLVFTGTPAGVGPLKIGDQLKGKIEGKKVLSCDIK